MGKLGGAKFLGLKCKLWGSHGPNMAQAQGLLGHFRVAVFGVQCNLENAKWLGLLLAFPKSNVSMDQERGYEFILRHAAQNQF